MKNVSEGAWVQKKFFVGPVDFRKISPNGLKDSAVEVGVVDLVVHVGVVGDREHLKIEFTKEAFQHLVEQSFVASSSDELAGEIVPQTSEDLLRAPDVQVEAWL